MDEEKVIKQDKANWLDGTVSKGGKIILTNKVIYFKAHRFNFCERKFHAIPLYMIKSIEISGLIFLTIKLINDKEMVYIMYKKKEWKEAIEEAIYKLKNKDDINNDFQNEEIKDTNEKESRKIFSKKKFIYSFISLIVIMTVLFIYSIYNKQQSYNKYTFVKEENNKFVCIDNNSELLYDENNDLIRYKNNEITYEYDSLNRIINVTLIDKENLSNKTVNNIVYKEDKIDCITSTTSYMEYRYDYYYKEDGDINYIILYRLIEDYSFKDIFLYEEIFCNGRSFIKETKKNSLGEVQSIRVFEEFEGIDFSNPYDVLNIKLLDYCFNFTTEISNDFGFELLYFVPINITNTIYESKYDRSGMLSQSNIYYDENDKYLGTDSDTSYIKYNGLNEENMESITYIASFFDDNGKYYFKKEFSNEYMVEEIIKYKVTDEIRISESEYNKIKSECINTMNREKVVYGIPLNNIVYRVGPDLRYKYFGMTSGNEPVYGVDAGFELDTGLLYCVDEYGNKIYVSSYGPINRPDIISKYENKDKLDNDLSSDLNLNDEEIQEEIQEKYEEEVIVENNEKILDEFEESKKIQEEPPKVEILNEDITVYFEYYELKYKVFDELSSNFKVKIIRNNDVILEKDKYISDYATSNEILLELGENRITVEIENESGLITKKEILVNMIAPTPKIVVEGLKLVTSFSVQNISYQIKNGYSSFNNEYDIYHVIIKNNDDIILDKDNFKFGDSSLETINLLKGDNKLEIIVTNRFGKTVNYVQNIFRE